MRLTLLIVVLTSLLSGCSPPNKASIDETKSVDKPKLKSIPDEYQVTEEEAEVIEKVNSILESDELSDDAFQEILLSAIRNCHKAVLRQLVLAKGEYSEQNEVVKTVENNSSEVACNNPLQLADYPVSLIHARGARSLAYYPDQFGGRYVTYILDQKYPAHNVIELFRTSLKRQGWKALKEDSLNPGTPTSHVRGWTKYRDATRNPALFTFAWKSAWTDEHGNITDVGLYYSDSIQGQQFKDQNEPQTSTLSVITSWIPVRRATELQKFFEELDVEQLPQSGKIGSD